MQAIMLVREAKAHLKDSVGDCVWNSSAIPNTPDTPDIAISDLIVDLR